jgi:heme iron utilization protein
VSEDCIVIVPVQIAIAEIVVDKTSSELGLIVTRARKLLRNFPVASLATIDPASGGPYASLITVATAADGSPIFLISQLAWHTRNLAADKRTSILISEAASSGDPLDVGRISLMGTARQSDDPRLRQRFLARHPSAAHYAGFADFAFWRLDVATAHYIGGFGRIVTLSGDELLLGPGDAERWDIGTAPVLNQINENHSNLAETLALARRPDAQSGWRVAAADPEGCDLVRQEDGMRLPFPTALTDPGEIHGALTALAEALPQPAIN